MNLVALGAAGVLTLSPMLDYCGPPNGQDNARLAKLCQMHGGVWTSNYGFNCISQDGRPTSTQQQICKNYAYNNNYDSTLDDRDIGYACGTLMVYIGGGNDYAADWCPDDWGGVGPCEG